MTAPVTLVEAIRIASSSGVSGDGCVRALVGLRAVLERDALGDAAGAPVLQRRGQRVAEEVLQARVLLPAAGESSAVVLI